MYILVVNLHVCDGDVDLSVDQTGTRVIVVATGRSRDVVDVCHVDIHSTNLHFGGKLVLQLVNARI